jgi:hypothetical protein
VVYWNDVKDANALDVEIRIARAWSWSMLATMLKFR